LLRAEGGGWLTIFKAADADLIGTYLRWTGKRLVLLAIDPPPAAFSLLFPATLPPSPFAARLCNICRPRKY